eukprot:180124-Prorocentrum_minimum.AAC.6
MKPPPPRPNEPLLHRLKVRARNRPVSSPLLSMIPPPPRPNEPLVRRPKVRARNRPVNSLDAA